MRSTPRRSRPPRPRYFNLTHPDKALRILDLDEGEADLNWNVAVGMVRPDEALREAIDGAHGTAARRRHGRSDQTVAMGSCCKRRGS